MNYCLKISLHILLKSCNLVFLFQLLEDIFTRKTLCVCDVAKSEKFNEFNSL